MKMDLNIILMRAEELFFKYCRKSVEDCFQVVDLEKISWHQSMNWWSLSLIRRSPPQKKSFYHQIRKKRSSFALFWNCVTQFYLIGDNCIIKQQAKGIL